jgi:CheY-like chemotaxis protein
LSLLFFGTQVNDEILTNKTILLADDDPDDVEIFISVLRDVDTSVAVYAVSSGVGVFEYLKDLDNPRPNVIFLDINMPEMSGWQCLTALKEAPVTRDIPVVMYSTSSHHRDKQIAAELGASGFITKPSDLKTLEKILGAVASNLHTDLKSTIRNFQ